MNRQEIEEYLRCANDIEYFIETYIKTVHVQHGKIGVKLNKFQKEAIKDFKEQTFFCKVGNRQEGKSFLAQALFLHESMFFEYKVNAYLGHSTAAARDAIEKITKMYHDLPQFLKDANKLEKSNKSELQFANGSAVYGFAADSNAIKGRTIANLYIDESEFVKNLQELVAKFLPVVSSLKKSRFFAFTSSRTNDIFDYNKRFIRA